MYSCESCGEIFLDNEKHLGICPKCSRDSLRQLLIICPFCHKPLRKSSQVDINTIGWVCSHSGFDVKIYLERENANIRRNNNKKQYK